MALCKSCGQENTEGTAFCSACGMSMTGAPEPTQPNQYQAPQSAPYQAPQSFNQYQQAGGNPVATVPPGYTQKSKMVAGLLGIFLGGLGVGRFYLGYSKIGILQLLVSVFTCGIGAIWGFIDGIMILTGNPKVDGKGIALKD